MNSVILLHTKEQTCQKKIQKKELYAAREDDLQKLTSLFDTAIKGKGQATLVTGVLGAGKRAMVGHVCRYAKQQNEDTLILRPNSQMKKMGKER